MARYQIIIALLNKTDTSIVQVQGTEGIFVYLIGHINIDIAIRRQILTFYQRWLRDFECVPCRRIKIYLIGKIVFPVLRQRALVLIRYLQCRSRTGEFQCFRASVSQASTIVQSSEVNDMVGGGNPPHLHYSCYHHQQHE